MTAVSYPFPKILIPYDGSQAAHKALEWAAHLVRAGGEAIENVTLLRVIGGGYLARHLHNVDLRVTHMDEVSAWRRMRQHHLDQEILPLLEEGKRSLQDKGVGANIETKVAEGKIGEEIIRLADKGGYNAIVIGRRGLSPVKGMLLGSVTRRVLSLAQKVTVFLVGEGAAFNSESPVTPLLLPVDGSEPSLAAVRQGAALAQGFMAGHSSLSLLYVIDVTKVTAALGEASSLVHEGEEILTDSHAMVLKAGFQGRVEDKFRVGDPPRVIAEEAEKGNYALVLMGARGLSPVKQLILGSVSNEVLHRVSRLVVGIVYL